MYTLTGIQCVYLTPFDNDVAVFGGLLLGSGIRMHHARTLEEADFLLLVTEACVLLFDPTGREDEWPEAAAMIELMHPACRLVLIEVTDDPRARTQRSDDRVHEIVARPIRLGPLRRAITGAHHAAPQRNW